MKRDAADSIAGVCLVVAIVLWVAWEFEISDRIADTPTLFYSRESCPYAEPCRTIWGTTSFRLNVGNQTAVGLREEPGMPTTVLTFDNCDIWDETNWWCESLYFGGHVGRRDGLWYVGDETLAAEGWKTAWLIASTQAGKNSAP